MMCLSGLLTFSMTRCLLRPWPISPTLTRFLTLVRKFATILTLTSACKSAVAISLRQESSAASSIGPDWDIEASALVMRWPSSAKTIAC